jgi:hypothetical protein
MILITMFEKMGHTINIFIYWRETIHNKNYNKILEMPFVPNEYHLVKGNTAFPSGDRTRRVSCLFPGGVRNGSDEVRKCFGVTKNSL